MDPVTVVLQALVIVLVLNILACLVRVVRGPAPRDRVAGVVLAGTTGAASLAVLSVIGPLPSLRDAGLVLVALALVLTVTMVTARPR
ncbi:hypothetical protein CEY15_08115 [Dietzia natronolimnaea]|uniref:Sodium:proton antiporter n=1 Tax=Dietzia natronolimnaea TaxID=161920 RepID=A0A2A2WQP8_9ACTN|nr:hypothetical protein [Dietzia natronolimnaea]PAY23532.1 hypothetical protein CEY15_08115 [Dietzia natronolimnaea]